MATTKDGRPLARRGGGGPKAKARESLITGALRKLYHGHLARGDEAVLGPGHLARGDEVIEKAFPDDALAGLAGLIGCTPRRLAPRLARWARVARSLTAPDQSGDATPREAREQLRGLVKTLDRTHEQLWGLSGPAAQALEERLEAGNLAGWRREYERLHHALARAITAAVASIKPPRHRPANLVTHELVARARRHL